MDGHKSYRFVVSTCPSASEMEVVSLKLPAFPPNLLAATPRPPTLASSRHLLGFFHRPFPCRPSRLRRFSLHSLMPHPPLLRRDRLLPSSKGAVLAPCRSAPWLPTAAKGLSVLRRDRDVSDEHHIGRIQGPGQPIPVDACRKPNFHVGSRRVVPGSDHHSRCSSTSSLSGGGISGCCSAREGCHHRTPRCARHSQPPWLCATGWVTRSSQCA